MANLTYRSAGVDIDAGNRLVQLIKPLVQATARPGASADIGGFAGLFDPKAAGFKDPLFMAATDGVGSKLKIASDMQRYDTIGIDLVAMCVNDLLVSGVEPLVFLDYLACGKLQAEWAESLIAGIAEGCKQAGCALIGGETAEMPGLYGDGDYDLAGFAVGAVERERLMAATGGAVGDILLALPSSGLHSNGFSLARYFLEEKKIALGDALPFDEAQTWGEFLLTPTRIYVKIILDLLKQHRVKAMSHITGGGLPDNLPRVLNDGLGVEVNLDGHVPSIYQHFHDNGINEEELLRTFNCGVGFVLVVDKDAMQAVSDSLIALGESPFTIGEITNGESRMRLFGE